MKIIKLITIESDLPQAVGMLERFTNRALKPMTVFESRSSSNHIENKTSTDEAINSTIFRLNLFCLKPQNWIVDDIKLVQDF
jgi:hypothetical protein